MNLVARCFTVSLQLTFLLVLAGVTTAPPQSAADDYYDYGDPDDEDEALGSDVTVDYFRDDLSPYGEWLRVPAYGWAWRPYDARADWRPYSRGRWLYTDYGWTWVADEPWGWAPYHYGRWYSDTRYGGWVWVPGRRWAPAWVDWRQGNDYVGWAPLPPTAVWQRGIGISPRTVVIEPRHYCFVQTRYIVQPNVVRHIVPPARNVTIINNTTNVTNYTVVNRRLANRGIQPKVVERAVGHQVPRVPVAEVKEAAPRAFRPKPGGRGMEAVLRPDERRDKVERADQRDKAERERARIEQQTREKEQAERARIERERADQERREKAERERARIEEQAREKGQAERARMEQERADQERREKAERERQEVEGRERARLERERAEGARRDAERLRDEERRREETRAREAAREQDAERQREALRRQEGERHDQEVRRREEAERAHEAERKAQEEARRRQAQQKDSSRRDSD